jgi:hypothetical protein
MKGAALKTAKMDGFGTGLTAYLTKIELNLPNSHKQNENMEVKHVPLGSGPPQFGCGGASTPFRPFSLRSELSMLGVTFWNRAGGGFADGFTSNQLDF